MPDPSSAPKPEFSHAARWPVKTRLLMLALGFVPLLHVAGVVATGIGIGGVAGLFWAVALLYGWPPLVTRLVLMLCPVRPGRHPVGSRAFLVWWATAQFQMLFCRLPALEEAMRLVPGLYSMWLRLWGAKIGRLTFWSPGLRILDRSFLIVGDDVIFGAGVRLNGHVIADEDGQKWLHLGPITLGDRVQVGGYSLLTAGVRVEEDQSLRAFTVLPPFSVCSEGRRQKATSSLTLP